VCLSQASAFLWPAISPASRYRGLTMRSQHKQAVCAYNLAREVGDSLPIPIGVRRPAATHEALGRSPWWRQAGHTPPVSNVFHSCPQLQNQRSSLRGDQPQSRHRMRGPDGSWVLS
jgi:hypothetical protein